MSRETFVRGLRSRRTLTLMAFDGSVFLFTYFLYALVRYDRVAFGMVKQHVLWLALAGVALMWLFGTVSRVYQGRVTVASMQETVLLVVSAGCSAVVLAVANTVPYPYWVSRGMPLGATFMALCLMILGRAVWRSQQERHQLRGASDGTRTLVFGAGSGGRQLVRSMLATPSSGLRPVGLLDDDPWKRRLRLYGVPVLGSRSDIATAATSTGATTLVIAVPSASPELVRDLTADAKEAGLEVKVLPTVGELFNGHVSIRDVRDINVHDLLGRGAIETDVDSIAGYLTGKRVLVTGAGGSIGSELCRQIHRWEPSELIMLDRDESALHAVQLSLHGRAMLDSPDVVLANIRDADTLTSIFVERRPEVVFHAAALKHLPMLEQYPAEAMKTNVLGTVNVLEAAAKVGVERFVNVSTDKAADPTSVLGYSKRLAERVTAAVAADTPGTYLSVRFGNVLGSRGSVLTAFASQIAAGGPVTVTDPDVTRYFMTIQEAVQLVIQAAAIGRDGEALILDMGEPVRIQDVALQLIEQSGRPIEIVYTGLRPGEKLHEVLLAAEEYDERPVHPLVSHVAVPELGPSRLRELSLDLPRGEMAREMQALCVTSEELAAADV